MEVYGSAAMTEVQHYEGLTDQKTAGADRGAVFGTVDVDSDSFVAVDEYWKDELVITGAGLELVDEGFVTALVGVHVEVGLGFVGMDFELVVVDEIHSCAALTGGDATRRFEVQQLVAEDLDLEAGTSSDLM